MIFRISREIMKKKSIFSLLNDPRIFNTSQNQERIRNEIHTEMSKCFNFVHQIKIHVEIHLIEMDFHSYIYFCQEISMKFHVFNPYDIPF